MIANEPAVRLVHIDAAGSNDLTDVMQIMASAFDTQFGEAWTRPQCAGILPMAGVFMRIARAENGSAVGFSLFRTVARESELLLLAVDSRNRGQGIGRRLLEDFLDRSRAEGVELVHLEVRENNAAIQMYSAAGFRTAGRRRDYYNGTDGSRFDALTLSRRL